MELPFLLTAFLLLLSSAAAAAATSTLDPKQLTALRSLGLSTKNPCSPPPSLPNATVCDSSAPFRHLLSLTVANCSGDVTLSTTALKSLSTLEDLRFLHCPLHLVHFPSSLSLNLHSFTCISSLRNLTGVWLSRLRNLTDLTISGVPIKASGPSIILGNLKKLQSVTISNCSLTGHLPKSWHRNITHLDLSINQLRGKIHPSITSLENLISLNLSSNQLSGELPASIGDLIDLKNLSLSSNSLSGSIPESMAALPSLSHLDLSSNQLNGSIPKFISEMKELSYLNLENNNFHGILPFNVSFIRRLKVFKVDENPNLCYNHSTISSKVKLGLAPCDKYGMPMSPPAGSVESGGDSDETDYSDSSEEESSSKKERGHHGPNKLVLGVAVALASIIFLIIFLILLSRRCA